MTGVPLIIAFVAAVALMILLISRLKVHPFLAIMGISLLLAIAAGIPLTEITTKHEHVTHSFQCLYLVLP